MQSTGFIIALVFAAVFGLLLISLILYYTHRYVHQQCLQLDHWFHLVSPWKSAATCCDTEKYLVCETCLRSRGRSAMRGKSRERSRKRYRSRDDGSRRVRQVETGWAAQPKMERPKRLLQMEAPVQNQWFGQPQYHQTLWQGQMPVPTQVAFPTQMPIPIQTAFPTQMPYPQPVAGHQQTRSEVVSDSKRSNHATVVQEDKPAPRRKRNRGPDKVDYVHICDELPSFVLKSLKKSPTASSLTSSSSSSSGDSGTTQEIPRNSIPRAGLQATQGIPFQYPE